VSTFPLLSEKYEKIMKIARRRPNEVDFQRVALTLAPKMSGGKEKNSEKCERMKNFSGNESEK
jgi:hypothetical protein